jgi:hypothetical protein
MWQVVLAAVASAMIMTTAATASAQDRPPASIDLQAGWVGFGDDGIVSETMIGAAVRWYVSPRVAIGPELLYIAESGEHSHFVATGNVTFDLLSPVNGRQRAVTPFLVIGGGLFQTQDELPGIESFTSNEGAFTAGGGVRVAANDRVSIGIDVRMGWEPHIRVNGLIGIRLF